MSAQGESDLVVLHGSIFDLATRPGEIDFLFTNSHRSAAGAVAIGLAASGLAGAAAGAQGAAGGAADTVEHFQFSLGSHRLAGCFSRVWFQNGDAVEVVAKKQSCGDLPVLALRRSADRTLWMYPHLWPRGRRSHRRNAAKVLLILCGLLVMEAGLACILQILGAVSEGLLLFTFVSSLTVVIAGLAIGDLPIGSGWIKKAACSERVFAALGYREPQWVDMNSQESRYWKEAAKAGEQRSAAPWVYRYVDDS